jgi:hypothetical protein
MLAGCAGETSQKPPESPPPAKPFDTANSRGISGTAPAEPPVVPASDGRPPAFDPDDAARTLRWFASRTEQFRQQALPRAQVAERWKAVQKRLGDEVGKKVTWKLPVGQTEADGVISLSPLLLTDFPERTEQRPHISLLVRPWNSANLAPAFKRPAEGEPAAGVRPGQDSVTVQGRVTSINTVEGYAWVVSLYDLRFNPPPDSGSVLRSDSQPPEELDPADADKSFAWLRQQYHRVADPFASPQDRDRRKKSLETRFRGLAGTRVSWRWPVTVDDNGVTVQPLAAYDYPTQMATAMGVLLRQPRQRGGPGQAAKGSEYGREFFGSPSGKRLTPEETAKIREAKKATVSGKIFKVGAADGGAYPPHALEIAILLDDVELTP